MIKDLPQIGDRHPNMIGVYLTGIWNDSRQRFIIQAGSEDFPNLIERRELYYQTEMLRWELWKGQLLCVTSFTPDFESVPREIPSLAGNPLLVFKVY